MNHAVSTHFLVNQRLTNVWLDRIYEAGIPAVEIFCAKQHLDWHNRAQINELAHWFSDAPLKLHSLHSPMFNDEVWGRTGPTSIINIADRSKPRRIAAVDEVKRALEIADQIPCRYLVQHLGAPVDDFDEGKLEAAFSSLEEISLFARHRGVEVLLENIPNGLSSAEKLNYFASGPPTSTTTTARTIIICSLPSAPPAPSTGRKPWPCSAPASISILSCSNSRPTRTSRNRSKPSSVSLKIWRKCKCPPLTSGSRTSPGTTVKP